MTHLNRRDFARGAALATAASYSRIQGANDRIHMGYIGLGNRGDHPAANSMLHYQYRPPYKLG